MIDAQNPHYWYVRTFVRQESAGGVGGEQNGAATATVREVEGWVEASVLQELGLYSDGARVGGGGVARRSHREVFREEVLQIANKKQEAAARRRCVISELLESERDYMTELAAVAAAVAKLASAGAPAPSEKIAPEKIASGGVPVPLPPPVHKFLQAHLLPALQSVCAFHECAY